MYTQVELLSVDGSTRVYWLDNEVGTQPKLRPGVGVRILEEEPYLLVSRVFTTLNNVEDLPVKSKIGTIVEIN